MARKNFITSFKMFDASTVTASTESATVGVIGLDYASISLVWSASDLDADVELQVRNGEKEPWRALDLGAVPEITGASGSHEIVLTQLPFTDMRLALTVNSGSSGLVTATVTAKSEGS